MRIHAVTRCLLVAVATAATFVGGASLRADVFRLRSGGQIEGEWLNRDEQPLLSYHVRAASGVVVRLQASAVKEQVGQTAERQQYAALVRSTPKTADGHWTLAEWCLRQRLFNERTEHLRSVLQLDPNHAKAHQALGHSYIEGAWVTNGEARRAEGYEQYKGRWRTAQEIELLETTAKRELAEREWLTKLRRYRAAMQDPQKAKVALAALNAIRDSAAVRPIVSLCEREPLRTMRMIYADVLANINSGESVQALVYIALHDIDEEVFYRCLDRLQKLHPPRLADAFVNSLSDSVNDRVNRAAIALGRIDDASAVSPLIDALITKHIRVKQSQFGADATATTFSSNGTSMMKNEGPQVQIVSVQNQKVLDALNRLSGGNTFGFDQRAWRYWYAQEKQAEQSRGRVDRR